MCRIAFKSLAGMRSRKMRSKFKSRDKRGNVLPIRANVG